MNIITIAGRLGVDPEIRFTSNGQKVTTLRVATNSRRGSKGGKEETIWWRVTIWGEDFDKMISFLKKGSAVIVVGELNKPEIFTDREGKPQVSLNITANNIMFSPFGKTDRSSNNLATNPTITTPNVENVQSSELEQNINEYASFTTGTKEESENQEFSGAKEKSEKQEFSDDEIPF